MKNKMITLAGLCACLLGAGCTTPTYLPPGAKVVGGGLKIDYKAPIDGTAILVDVANRKTVATESLSEGSDFDFNAFSATDESVLEALYGGAKPANARFVLYFVPTKEKE